MPPKAAIPFVRQSVSESIHDTAYRINDGPRLSGESQQLVALSRQSVARSRALLDRLSEREFAHRMKAEFARERREFETTGRKRPRPKR